jgi:hypothetical protein
VDSISLTGGGDLSNQPPSVTSAATSSSVETITDSESNVWRIQRGTSGALSVTGSVNLRVVKTATGLVVSPAAASVTITNLIQTHTGSPRPVTVTTNPTGLGVAVTYDGNATAPSAIGSYAVHASVTDPNHQGESSATLVIQPANDFDNWVDSRFSPGQQLAGEAGETADPDADGLTNLAEYALGTEPYAFTPPMSATLDGNGLTLVFTRPAGLADVTYTAETSDTLGIWTSVPLEVIATGQTETVRARDPLTTGPPRKFIRLRFTRQ